MTAAVSGDGSGRVGTDMASAVSGEGSSDRVRTNMAAAVSGG
jgi:hypothetical protein